MYYVTYVTTRKEEVTERFATREEAIRFYKENFRNMAYGYISDEEARETAEEVKADFEENLAEEEDFLRALLTM